MSHIVTTTALLLAALAALAGCGGSAAVSSRATATALQKQAENVEPGAAAVQQQFVDVVKAVSPSVVQIQSGDALGSGVVLDDRGDIVTNAHVVDGAKEFVVTLPGGDEHDASLVGADRDHDVAVIRLADATPEPATFGDSSKVEVGDLVLALGNPLGLRSSVTQGIVSSLDRTLSENGGTTLSSTIQTSAEINPGNSGGALVDLSGRVVGIPTVVATDPEFGNTPAPGIGFAISGNAARRVASQLIAGP